MKLSHDAQLGRVVERLARLQEQKFFGRVTLDIQAGNILRMVTEHSEKIDGRPSQEARPEGERD